MNCDLSEGKPEKVLCKFALPLFLSIIFQQLYTIADSFVAGRYAGEHALAAVGNSYELTLIYLAVAFGCNMGCSIIVSRLFGEKKTSDLKTAVSTTYIASGILCIMLTAMGIIFGRPLLELIKTPPEILTDSYTYFYIYTLGICFLFFYNISTGIFSAMGDSKTPFIFLVISSVSNVFVDILFVKYYHMGVKGVAIATFLCQGVSCIFSMATITLRLRKMKTNDKPKIFSKKLLGEISYIAIPSMLQQSFIAIGNIFIQGVINSYGASVIAGYSAAVKLNNLVITSITTIGNAMSNFTAQNLGAGKPERISKGYQGALKMVYIICVPIVLLYLFFGNYFVNLFMEDASDMALKTGGQFLRIVAPFYFVVGTKLVSDGVLRGSSDMVKFMIATFTDLLLRVVFAFIFSAIFGSVGIWCSWPVGWCIAAVMSVVFYRKRKI